LQSLQQTATDAFDQVSSAQNALLDQADSRSQSILAREHAEAADADAMAARFKAEAAQAAVEELSNPQACQDCEELHNREAS
jgi:hypothetical protein